MSNEVTRIITTPNFRSIVEEALPVGSGIVTLDPHVDLNDEKTRRSIFGFGTINQFKVLSLFPPKHRMALLEQMNWSTVADSLANTTSTEANNIASAAEETLGTININALSHGYLNHALDHNWQQRSVRMVEVYLRAGIRLARLLPIQDMPAIFAKYSNIARMTAHQPYPKDRDSINYRFWNKLFAEGLDTLYCSIQFNTHKELQATKEEISNILSTVLTNDMKDIAAMIIYPGGDSFSRSVAEEANNFVLNNLRNFLNDPDVLDNLLIPMGYIYDSKKGEYKDDHVTKSRL